MYKSSRVLQNIFLPSGVDFNFDEFVLIASRLKPNGRQISLISKSDVKPRYLMQENY